MPRALRVAALIAVVAGAAGSLGLMFRVGARPNSRLLILLFTLWVLAPFVALVLADVISKRSSVRTRATLHGVMMLLSLGSVALYADVAFGPPRPQPAFMFLVVPLASLVLIAIIGVALKVAGR